MARHRPIPMKEQLDQIRRRLDDLEVQASEGLLPESGSDFSALELPLVIQEIVDDLQPLLTPYGAAFYWYMFRHSIAENGNSLVRISTRGLRDGIIQSKKSINTDGNTDGKVSYKTVQEALAALESISGIRKEGEPNREGTLYRILIPDEIEACRKFRADRLKMSAKPEISEKDIDYYNVRENRIKVFERDSYKCHYCGKQLTRFTATLDHLKPISAGGDNSFENLLTACLSCNSRKNRRAVSDFLADQAG